MEVHKVPGLRERNLAGLEIKIMNLVWRARVPTSLLYRGAEQGWPMSTFNRSLKETINSLADHYLAAGLHTDSLEKLKLYTLKALDLNPEIRPKPYWKLWQARGLHPSGRLCRQTEYVCLSRKSMDFLTRQIEGWREEYFLAAEHGETETLFARLSYTVQRQNNKRDELANPTP